ncbi:MAG: DUF5618 family protein [Bacteroidales bacterium]|nr:DUF5618 family protein [Bacteroidales bacterium]
MKDLMIEPVVDPVSEARRYVANAQELLRDHGKLDFETQLYQDRKYVRMAGNTLWNGVLLIVDAVFHVKTNNRMHPDVDDYRFSISRRDHKLLDLFNTAHETLHVYMGYDGNRRKNLCQDGIHLAIEIIDRCELMLKNRSAFQLDKT